MTTVLFEKFPWILTELKEVALESANYKLLMVAILHEPQELTVVTPVPSKTVHSDPVVFVVVVVPPSNQSHDVPIDDPFIEVFYRVRRENS